LFGSPLVPAVPWLWLELSDDPDVEPEVPDWAELGGSLPLLWPGGVAECPFLVLVDELDVDELVAVVGAAVEPDEPESKELDELLEESDGAGSFFACPGGE
jgi:hypothetical protein